MNKSVLLPIIATSLLLACAQKPQQFRSSFVEFDYPTDWLLSADSSDGSMYIELLTQDSNVMMFSALKGIMPPEFTIDVFWSAYSHSLPDSFRLEKSDSLRFCYFGGYEARCLDYILRGGSEVMKGNIYCFNASGNTFTLQRYAIDASIDKFTVDSEIIEKTIYFP